MRAVLAAARLGATFGALILCACGSSNAPEDECRPLDTICRGRAIMICHPDIEWQRKGKTVYVLEEAETCDDDEVLGASSCVETKTSTGRIDAECTYED